MSRQIMVRHFRQIIVWPIQLMPLRPNEQVQRHWEALERIEAENPWKELVDEFGADADCFQERHYKEFVTYLPYVQRFLYGSTVGQEATRKGHGEAGMRVFRRADVAQVRISYDDGARLSFDVAHVDLYFFLDADVAVLVLEMHANDLSLERMQDTLFRFGRAYPAFWEGGSVAGNCPRLVEWLDAGGNVLATSDYDDCAKYRRFVHRYRSPCIARHWEHLLQPLALERVGEKAVLRYRQLEYYRMPFMVYLAVDDPTALTRADFVRLALVTRSGDPDTLPYSIASLTDFEREYCEDRFWGRAGGGFSGDTRIIVSGPAFAVVGRHDDWFFAGPDTGMLGQFRHQYFLLFLIAHFNKAALVSISDELAVAMNRLTVGDTASVKQFKRTIRQATEVFLRFTHRYYFHEVSHQALAKTVYGRLQDRLGTEKLYEEVRNEVIDMSAYLDSDSARRQANTIVRLTVVTIFGLIGTVVSGLLGMNLLSESHRPLAERVLIFLVFTAAVCALTVATIVRSKRLADFLDSLSDERVSWRSKGRILLDAFKSAKPA